MSRATIKDPMLHAAAEGLTDADHLRWLSYADDELARLRDAVRLPTPRGYNAGLPDYEVVVSAKARGMIRDVENRCGGRLSPNDFRAWAEVIDGVLREAGVC